MNRLEYFKKLLSNAKDNPMVHYSLAQEYFKIKDYENAIKHVEEYLRLQEDEGAIYRLLARCYEELGEFGKAVEVLEEGIRQAMKFNHPSMADEYRQWAEELRNLSF
ncbi:MAG: tetratricopeptide repeat protein [Aquificota bacterium]|nr:tetratricopeptide repeat protein [Aquificota bacterium]